MIGYQLYSSRNWPLDETLRMLRGLGYETVEGFEGLYPTMDDAKRLRDALDEAGMRMPTGHISIGMLESDPDLALDIARTLGFEAAFAPYRAEDERPRDAEG
ncbi:MAG: sugar phosphate isomerase/epimerase family protein, partial [Hasllibacter sp.]